MSPKKVLIICFTFPPYPGIGGRRWAKFAKYLQQYSWDIEVIAAKKLLNERSPWESDIATFAEKVTYLPMNYPSILTTIPKSTIQKIQYRLAWFCMKFRVKGNYFDHSALIGRTLKSEVETKIKKGFNKVLISCAPFHMAFEIIQLKKQYPAVQFIVDFRDPWTNNKSSFGLANLPANRLKVEQQKEQHVVNHYDKVISVSDEMTNYFKTLEKENPDKCLTIPNGFDSEDFSSNVETNVTKDYCRFIFTGSLYDKSLHMFLAFCNALKEIKNNSPEIDKTLKVDFYGYVPESFYKITEGLNNVNFHGTIEMKSVYKEISNSDIALLFLTDDLNYTFSTKFYEYVSNNKPIFVVSKEGITGKYVEEHKLGYSISSEKVKDKIIEIYNHWKEGSLINNHTYDISQHDIAKITKNQLIKVLESGS